MKVNFLWRQLAKGKLFGVNYLRRNCPRVNYLEDNYPGGNNLGQLPWGKLSGGQSSRGQFSSGEIVKTVISTYNTISTSNFISTGNSTAILFYVTGLVFLITFSILIYLAPSAKLVCTACYFHFNHGFESQYICWKLTDFYEALLTGSLNFPQRNKGYLE